jgi:hypothetical protein
MHDAAARVDEEYTGFCWYSWVDSNHRPPDPQFEGHQLFPFATFCEYRVNPLEISTSILNAFAGV